MSREQILIDLSVMAINQRVKIKQLESLLEESLEVIRFYGNKDHYPTVWGYMRINGDDYYDCDKEYLGNDGGKDRHNLTGGKRARKFLKKVEQMKKD